MFPPLESLDFAGRVPVFLGAKHWTPIAGHLWKSKFRVLSAVRSKSLAG